MRKAAAKAKVTKVDDARSVTEASHQKAQINIADSRQRATLTPNPPDDVRFLDVKKLYRLDSTNTQGPAHLSAALKANCLFVGDPVTAWRWTKPENRSSR